MSFLRPFRNAMGIDVSDQVLRMVQLVPRGHAFTLRSISARPLPEGVIVEGEVRNPTKAAAVLRDLIQKPRHHHPTTKSATLCLPERKTFTKIIEVPRQAATTFETALREGLAENIPLKLDEAYVDWQIIPSQSEKTKTVRVIVAVAPQLLVEGFLTMCQLAGIVPVVLEPESAALCRSALDVQPAPGSHLIIDLGATRTGIIIAETDLVAYSSTVNLSGIGLTQVLQTKLGLNAEEAEQAKRICGLDPKRGKGAVKATLEPEFRPLFQRILEVISFYEEHAPKQAKVQDITLVGGGARLSFLPELVQSTISLPVRVGSWPKSVNIPSDDLLRIGPSYLTALGLALRGAMGASWSSPHAL
ncbi:MAG: type IV pilus assembly protein PilM [Patescibacteria group bacterium]